MVASNMGPVPAEFPQKRDVIADCGAQGPMSQWALTAMRCIRKNWCSWSADMIQMRKSTKQRIVSPGSLRHDRRAQVEKSTSPLIAQVWPGDLVP
jgi:hypothetical protein